MNEIVLLGGLPRSGSTLLANILAIHDQVYSTPSSSLVEIIEGVRAVWSDDIFMLSQFDLNFDELHLKIQNTLQAIIDAWCDNKKLRGSSSDHFITVDKNRKWAKLYNLMHNLNPTTKLILTTRELSAIIQSVEKHHKNSFCLKFGDNTDPDLYLNRISQVVSPQGIVGEAIHWIRNLDYMQGIEKNIFVVRYEDLISDPISVTDTLFKWLGLPEVPEIDFDNIPQSTHENDGILRMKYPHKIESAIHQVEAYPIAPQIQFDLIKQFQWYYQKFYPEIISKINNQSSQLIPTPTPTNQDEVQSELEQIIESEQDS